MAAVGSAHSPSAAASWNKGHARGKCESGGEPKTSHLSTRLPGGWRLTYKGALAHPTVRHRHSAFRGHYEEYRVNYSIEMLKFPFWVRVFLKSENKQTKKMAVKGWVSIFHNKGITCGQARSEMQWYNSMRSLCGSGPPLFSSIQSLSE